MQTETRRGWGGGAAGPAARLRLLHASRGTDRAGLTVYMRQIAQKAPAPRMQDRAQRPRPCSHAGARHHANGTPGGTTGSGLSRRWAPGPREGCSGVPAQLTPLRLPGHLNAPTKGISLQPPCAGPHRALEGNQTRDCGVSGLSAQPCPTTALSRLRGEPGGLCPGRWAPPRDCATSAAVEAELRERCWACRVGGGDERLNTCGLRNCKGGRETSSCIRRG